MLSKNEVISISGGNILIVAFSSSVLCLGVFRRYESEMFSK